MIRTVLLNELVNYESQVKFCDASHSTTRHEIEVVESLIEGSPARRAERQLEACEKELARNLFFNGGRTVAKKAAKKAAPKKAAKKSAKKAAKKR